MNNNESHDRVEELLKSVGLWEMVEQHYACRCADHEAAARADERAKMLARIRAELSGRNSLCIGDVLDAIETETP